MKIRKLNEASEGFQKEFYKDYVILKNRAGDGWDIYSYEGTPEKVTRAVREEEGLATLEDAKATIDSWADKVDEGIDGWDNRTGVIKRIDKYLSSNPEATPPKGYIAKRTRAYDDAVSRYGDYVTTPFGNISTDDLMQYARDNKLLDETITEDKPIKKSLKYSQESFDKAYQFLKDATDNFTKEGRFTLPKDINSTACEDILSDHYESSGLTGDSENPTYPEEVRAFKPISTAVNESVESKFTLNEALFTEDYSDEVVTLSRYLDVEVPDICSGVLDLIEHLPSHKIVYITKICRDFYAKMESIIKNYTMTDDNFDESLKEHIMADIPQDVSEEEHLKSLIGAKVEFRNKYMNRMSGHKGVITGIDNSGPRLKANVHWEFDDINSPYDLEFLGSVPYLSDAKATESLKEDVTDVVTDTLSGPTEGPESGLSALLNEAVQDEFKTIQMYNDIAVSARAEGFEDIATVVDEINTEENKHVGQLQELLKTVSPNAKAIDTGEIEGQQQIGEVTDIVEEDLNNSNSSPNNNIEEDDKVMKESWEEVYQSFKTIEKELNGDGEAITATVDQLYRDNKGNPDYEKAYKKWASGE